jgi:two-component system, OmpR family, phosphate regulon sensor histidine kinase PhoR
MRKKILALVFLGIISILGIIAVQLYIIQLAYANEEREFSRLVHIALKRVAEEIVTTQGGTLTNKSPVKEINFDNYVVQTGVNVNVDLLDYYLNKEFNDFNILADYEYAYYDCYSGKMVYGKYIVHQGTTKITKSDISPCPGQVYYFTVKFPRSSDYFKSRVRFWKLTTIVLVLVIIFFGFTLFVVFKQKFLSEIQKDFVNTMSHEIKTPVSTIAISANVLMQPDIINEPARLLNYASIISSENQRLLNLSDKILQMARTEKADFKLLLEKVNVNEIISEVSSKISDKSIVSTQLNAQNYVIKADKIHFSNVIFNLIDNAVKYSVHPASVNISTENIGKYIAVNVADKGIGIRKEHQKLIFQKFYRVEGVDLPNVKGFGLGLNYVRNIVDAHKWSINVQSAIGKGSKFTILIPII